LLAERRAEAIFIELNPKTLAAAGTSTAEVAAALVHHGYTGHLIEADGRRLAPLPAMTETAVFLNAVFLPTR
jgi:hypothetical protein